MFNVIGASSEMRILQIHNHYLQAGGEDTVFESEVTLLRRYGHQVAAYVESNERIASLSPASAAAQTIWSWDTYRKLSDLIKTEKPDVAHFHNTFPLISPSAYYACRDAGVPVAQWLHNPRLACPAATFHRDGKICTECLGKALPYPGILYGCYHGSMLQTSVIAAMLTIHRLIGTWKNMVNRYVVATSFYRDLFIRAGLPEEKIVYKPHFVEPSIRYDDARGEGNYALFVGRLAPEKGVRTLLAAWQKTNIPLKIRGSGQLEGEVRRSIDQSRSGNIEIIGVLPKEDLDRLISNARFLVWPSEGFYETFGLVAVESYSLGVPVVGSCIGVNAEMVHDGETGLYFTAGDPDDLADKLTWAWEHPEEMRKMGRNARREYEMKYTPAKNYEMLIELYQSMILDRKKQV